jgi:5-methylcytosine-specific restriction endonuclease McrA
MRPATKKRIKELGYKGYTAYCRSPVWLAVRKSYFSRHPKICWICGSDKKIHLHHACYDRLGGQELDSDLVPLCQAHHRGLHTWMKRHRVKLEVAHPRYKAHLACRKPRSRVRSRP